MATIDVLDAAGSTVSLEKPLAPGAAAASASRPVTLSTENVAAIGALTETAPASDTASSGLNGRLQRIAQNITSAITHLATLAGAISSSRMAVNPISGQVGIAGGTGTDGATVPRVSLATNVALPAGTNNLGAVTPEGVEYETVAASQTAQVMGASGASGDYLAGVVIVPATTSPGNVIILDNATSITVFTGGASSVNNLIPFFVPLGIKSVSGAWKITTGSNVSAIGIGNFT